MKAENRSFARSALLRHVRLGGLLSIGLLAAATAVGCGSSDSSSAPAADDQGDMTPDAESTLDDLDVDPSELIADQAVSEDELKNLQWPEANEDDEFVATTDLDDVSNFDIADDFPEELPDPDADSGEDAPEIFAKVKNPPWWTKKFACAHNPLHASCDCRGSLYNCQFPNPQPGRNRYLPPKAIAELKKEKDKGARHDIISYIGKWDLKAGEQLFDGAGHPRGEVVGGCYSAPKKSVDLGHPCVKINFGQLKKMQVDGSTEKKSYVYAFAVTLRGGASAGGWVLADAITNPSFKRYNTPVRSASQFAGTKYVVKSAEDFRCDPASYSSDKCLPAWAQLKIRPRSPETVSEKARDYMLRDGNTLNLAYQTPLVGGAATDTFMVAKDKLAFKRAKSIDSDHRTILRISLYHAKVGSNPGTAVKGHMYFVYGEIEGRFGWVAAASIKKGDVASAASAGGGGGGSTGGGGSATPTPSGDSCTGKSNGYYCSGSVNTLAFKCENGSGEGQRGILCSNGGTCKTGSNGQASVVNGVLQCNDP